MNKGGIGVGSASIVLVFAVLCLTIFSLITLSTANANKALTDAEVRLVKGYYEADTQAEVILAELLAAETLPNAVRGVEIIAGWNEDLGVETAEFYCPISSGKQLYVKIAVYEDACDVLNWQMRDSGDWEIDERLPVWLGD